MALFESYERRIAKIEEVLAANGIASLEEAKAICDEKDIKIILSYLYLIYFQNNLRHCPIS